MKLQREITRATCANRRCGQKPAMQAILRRLCFAGSYTSPVPRVRLALTVVHFPFSITMAKAPADARLAEHEDDNGIMYSVCRNAKPCRHNSTRGMVPLQFTSGGE